MKQNFALTLSLMGVLLLLTACVKEKTDDEKLRPVGSEIVFSAATSYENEDATRTVYTGKDENNNTITTSSGIERIDWENDDRMSIVYAANSTTQAEYAVTNVLSSSDENDLADVEATGTKLVWGSGNSHVFCAMYPTSTSGWSHSNGDATLSAAGAVHGSIPSSQALGTLNTTQGKYLPDMKYAYMVGYANGSNISGNRVTIPFTPAVTAFNFIFNAKEAVTITKFELISQSTLLAGTFDFNIDLTQGKERNNRVVGAKWGTVTTAAPTAANDDGKTITIDFGSGRTLAKNETLDFTVFALPIAQSGLSLRFTCQNNGLTYTRTLELKDNNNSWHTFAAAKKHIVTNDELAGITPEYVFTVTNPAAYAYTGGTNTYSVTSYKKIGTQTAPLKWDVVGYSVNGGSSWITTKPAHLTDFTTTATPTGTSATSYNATLAATPRSGLGTKTAKGTESAPFDLSLWSNRTGAAVQETTANCYIVDAPGWYMFPLKYGATRKNGSTMTQAYDPNDQNNTYFLNRYVDHLGNNLNVNIANQSTFKIHTVALVWQDSEYLIQNVGFHDHTAGQQHAGGYVKFYVAPERINPGNAVIAVKDENGKIAWSWHIWVTDQDMKPATIRSKSFMSVNLGYLDDGTYTNAARSVQVKLKQTESNTEKIITLTQNSGSVTNYRTNTHYQWGRKDPFIPPKGLGQTGNKTIYDASGSTITGITISNGESSANGTIPEGILNPTTLYVNTIKNETPWLSAPKCNLWNYNQTAVSGTVNKLASHGKTAYDPCPIGYTVPTVKDMEYFQTTSSDAYSNQNTYTHSWVNYGQTFDSNFWGAFGHRSRIANNVSFTDADANNFQTYGYYYTSIAHLASSKNCIYLEFYDNALHLTQGAQSAANSIRCIAE